MDVEMMPEAGAVVGAHGGHPPPQQPQPVPESPLSPPLSPASAAAAALANARWNPTKEQTAVLEGLFEHGLRTPTAEQIRQITARLREHGAIEGKNVFYWFQNHKARDRQRQKQDNFAYFTRLLRRPPPLPVLAARPPAPLPAPALPYHPHAGAARLPSPAVMTMAPPPPPACNIVNNTGTQVMYRTPAYYMPVPQAPAGAYYQYTQQQQMALLYAQANQMNQAAAAMYHAPPYNANTTPLHMSHFSSAANGGGAPDNHFAGSPNRETLQLFPLQPTFVLPDDDKARGGLQTTTPASPSFSGESESLEESPVYSNGADAVPFYDFFGLHSGGR